MRVDFTYIASDSTAAAQRLQSDSKTTSRLLRVNCAAVAKWYHVFARRLSGNCGPIATQLRSSFIDTSSLLRGERVPIVQQLRIDYTAIIKRLQSDCAVLSWRA
jgi:hypothetical protein